MKTKPITLRFEQEHLDLLMEKEGYDSPGKAINFLLARYFWSHQLGGNGVHQVEQAPAGDVKTGSGKPIADIPKPESASIALYKSYVEKLKAATSIDEIVQLDEEIKESDFSTKEKQELHFMAVNFSRKLD